jgi:hypothetical protein
MYVHPQWNRFPVASISRKVGDRKLKEQDSSILHDYFSAGTGRKNIASK